MWELIVTVYLTVGQGPTTIDRQPPRPQADRAACDTSVAAVVSAPRDPGVRFVAYCVARPGVQ